MLQVFVFLLVGLVTTSWLLPVSAASGLPALLDTQHQTSECIRRSRDPRIILLDYCTSTSQSLPRKSEDDAPVIVRSKLVTLVGSGNFTSRLFTSPDCIGPVADINTPTVELGGCEENSRIAFEQYVKTEVLPGTYAGFAVWITKSFPGSTGATCFPEITSFDPLEGLRLGTYFIPAGSCFTFGTFGEFNSALVTSSASEFADATLYSNHDCTGKAAPLEGCRQLGDRMVYVGDLRPPKIPENPATGSKPFSSLGLALTILFHYVLQVST